MVELTDKTSSIINNNYKIIKLIGSGGMGNVYLAEDIKLDRLVALKTLKSPDNIENSDEYIERFKNEAKSIAKLTHPNIVNIYDIGSTNEFDYMAMEYVEGKDLQEVLLDKTLSLGSIIKISKQLCEVIAFVHSKNILHRDIKTSNILIGDNYNIKLTDFGIAKTNNDQAMLTQAGTILGSILYSPPEQFINVKSLDERSDLYSAAVCIYEMLVGSPPFANKNNIQEIILSIMTEKIPPPSECSDKIPVFFDDILLKALNKDPDKRYNDMSEMLKDIEFVEKNFIISDTPNSSLLSRDFLKSTLNNARIRDTRISSQLDLTNTTLSINEFVKGLHLNLSWLHKVLSDYETNNEDLHCSEVLEKIRTKSLNGRRFSGVVANETHYLFVHEGIIIGAFDIVNKTFGDEVFEQINNTTIFNKIINTRKDENINLLLYSTLTLDGECIKSNLNSSQINLFEIIDELNTENSKFSSQVVCQQSKDSNDKNKYVFVYNNGKIILTIKVSKDNSIILEDILLEDFLKQGNITINIYKPKLSIPKRELENIMVKSEFILKYKEIYDGTLSEIVNLGKEEVSHCLAEAVKNNIYFDIKLNSGVDKINFFEQEIDITDFIKNNNAYYKSSLWIVTEFLFLVNTSNNISYFKDLYKASSEIVKFSILDELKGYYGCSNEYSIIAKDANDRVIFLARFGNGSKEDIEVFMEETVLVKKNLQKQKSKELYSAFYISNQRIDNLSLSYYYKNVKQEAGIFNKAKAYIKVSFTDGFNVLLLQNINDDISLAAPNLFQN